MTAAVLIVLAFVIPALIFLALKPGTATREAQLRSGLVLFGSALVLGAGGHFYSQGRNPVIQLVSGAVLIAGGAAILVKGRQH